mmetsp:Transcript_7744/g.13034  ORF Transcript_7744/g.13034 Transcript_7744/m.13034 type:complete len:203 (+) Transcript_7744:235-843(+)
MLPTQARSRRCRLGLRSLLHGRGEDWDAGAIVKDLKGLVALAVLEGDQRQLHDLLLGRNLAQFGADPRAKEARVARGPVLPDAVRRVRCVELHAQHVAALGRDVLTEANEIGRAHATRRELEGLERVLHVRVAVRESRRIRENLGQDFCRLGLPRRLGSGHGVARHGRQLSILEGQAADEGGNGVDEPEGRDHVDLAVVEQV